MENIETVIHELDKLFARATPNVENRDAEDAFKSMMAFQEHAKKDGLNLANSLINDSEPLMTILKKSLGENNSTYKAYSNKFVDAVTTFIFIQVNGKIVLSGANDLSQEQKVKLINENTHTISLINKLSKYYRNNDVEDYVNQIKNKVTYIEKQVNPSASCYIATIIYSDYNSQEVYLLREFRDSILAKNLIGRTLIYIYYNSSPMIKPIIKSSHILQYYIKYFLDKLILFKLKK